jgi:phosphoglycerate dehydrogenase-like enzyme
MTTLFASAPGKIILFGEHAVNRRQPALVTAFNRRVHCPATIRDDDQYSLTFGVESALASRAQLLAFKTEIDGLRAAEKIDTQLEAAGCEVIPNNIGRAYRAAELLEALHDVDAIITGTDELTAEVIAAADRLRTIAKHGVGLDAIDLTATREREIGITATPDAIQDSVADLTLGLLLTLARRIVPAYLSLRDGHWQAFVGLELHGKTLGLVGLGRIGKEVCHRAQAFGMRVVAFDPFPDAAFGATHDVSFLPFADVLAVADVVSLHAGLTTGTAPLIGAAELATMKPSALLINTARGHLVDETALADALRRGRLAGAGLDVFAIEPLGASPLRALHNVVLTPHIGGQTTEGLLRMGQMTVENCMRALRGEEPLFAV